MNCFQKQSLGVLLPGLLSNGMKCKINEYNREREYERLYLLNIKTTQKCIWAWRTSYDVPDMLMLSISLPVQRKKQYGLDFHTSLVTISTCASDHLAPLKQSQLGIHYDLNDNPILSLWSQQSCCISRRPVSLFRMKCHVMRFAAQPSALQWQDEVVVLIGMRERILFSARVM